MTCNDESDPDIQFKFIAAPPWHATQDATTLIMPVTVTRITDSLVVRDCKRLSGLYFA